MAGGTLIQAFASDEVKMRWREPYVTEGLNKKLAGVVPRGIYRGFRLVPNAGAMLVTVQADPTKGDHVAVYETDTGVTTRYSMRVEITAGNFDLNLNQAGWLGNTVYIAIYAEYTTLATTAANIRVYTEAEYLGAVEKDELVILGKVNVPDSVIVIPDADITGDARTLPWANESEGARPWLPLLTNPSFEQGGLVTGVQGDTVPEWFLDPEGSSTHMQWSVVNTDAAVGAHCLEMEALTTSASDIYAANILALAVLPTQRIRWKFSYKIVASASTGSMTFNFLFDATEPASASTLVVAATVDLTAAPGSWVELEGIIEVPTGRYILYQTYFDCDPIQYAAAGIGFRLDGVQCWVERDETQAPPIDSRRAAQVHAGKLILREDGSLDPTDGAELVGLSNGAIFQRTDHVNTATQPKLFLNGQLSVGANLLDTANRAAQPRIQINYSNTYAYTCLWQWATDAINGSKGGVWADDSGEINWVSGTVWNGTQWAASALQSHHSKFSQSPQALVFQYHNGVTAFTDGSWSTYFSVDTSADETYVRNLRTNTPGATQPSITIGGLGSLSAPRFIRLFPFSTTTYGREYSLHGGGGLNIWHTLTYNATYDFATLKYAPDDTGVRAMAVKWGPAQLLGFFGGQLIYWKNYPTGASWDDDSTPTGWDEFIGMGIVPTATGFKPTVYLPSDTDTDADEFTINAVEGLFNRNIVKAWLVCSSVVGPSGPITTFEGYNIGSVSQDASGYIVVTLGTALNAMNQIAAIPNFHDGTTTADHTASATIVATNQIRIACWANGAFASANSYENRVSLVVLGVS